MSWSLFLFSQHSHWISDSCWKFCPFNTVCKCTLCQGHCSSLFPSSEPSPCTSRDRQASFSEGCPPKVPLSKKNHFLLEKIETKKQIHLSISFLFCINTPREAEPEGKNVHRSVVKVGEKMIKLSVGSNEIRGLFFLLLENRIISQYSLLSTWSCGFS